MINSRKITDLTPETQAKYWKFSEEMAKAHIPYMVTSTFRDQEAQDALWNQGRKGRTAQDKIVTWTRRSRHTQRDAFDIALLLSGEPVWSPKVDIDNDHIPDYLEAGQIGESCGLVWGGRFKDGKGRPRPDSAHFQNT